MAYSKMKFNNREESYYKDKETIAHSYRNYFLIKLQKMFRYLNLPDTVPQYILEHYLMVSGQCLFTKHDDKYFVFIGSRGNEPDVYYEGTSYIVANPALKLSKEYKLYNKYHEPSGEAVLCKNDPYGMGLSPLLSRFSWLLAENVITLRVADVLLRMIALLNGNSDKEKREAEELLTKIDKGELAAIASNPFFEGIQMMTQDGSSSAYVNQFIELHQYYKGSFYNEIGLNANFNMKREAIGDSESALNEDVLMPLADEMLATRQEFCKQINDTFALNLSVDFSSAWELNQTERIYQLESIKNDALGTQNQNENQEDNKDGEENSEGLDTENSAENSAENSEGPDTENSAENSAENSEEPDTENSAENSEEPGAENSEESDTENSEDSEPNTDNSEPNTDNSEPNTDNSKPNTDNSEPNADTSEQSQEGDAMAQTVTVNINIGTSSEETVGTQNETSSEETLGTQNETSSEENLGAQNEKEDE